MKNKKLLKFILVLMLVLIVANFIINKYIIEELPISQRIGNYSPMSVSLNDSIYIKTYSTTKYLNFIENQKYDLAYAMLTDEYKKYKPYDDYLSEIKTLDYKNMNVKSIKQLGEYSYAIELENSETGDVSLYTVYANRINQKLFYISPDKFIYYDDPNNKIKSNGVEAVLKSYTVMKDSIEMQLTVKNNTSKTQTIEDVKVYLTNGGVLNNKLDKIELQPKEETELTVSYAETNYYIPSEIDVETEKTTLTFKL